MAEVEGLYGVRVGEQADQPRLALKAKARILIATRQIEHLDSDEATYCELLSCEYAGCTTTPQRTHEAVAMVKLLIAEMIHGLCKRRHGLNHVLVEVVVGSVWGRVTSGI